MICVSISKATQIPAVLQTGVELMELRLDLINNEPALIYSRLPNDLKTIATYRPNGSSKEKRIRDLKLCVERGASYVDLELESDQEYLRILSDYAREHGCEVIISYHNFDNTPYQQELGTVLKSCYDRGGEIAKVTTMVHSEKDVISLLSLFNIPGRKVILGMGPKGRITRLVGPYLGAEFTFASPGEGSETAPGQFSAQQLKDIFNAIDRS